MSLRAATVQAPGVTRTGSVLINNESFGVCFIITIDRQSVIGCASKLPCVLIGLDFNRCGNRRVIKTRAVALERDLSCLSGSLMIISPEFCRREFGRDLKE